jgi:endonuclease-3
MKKQERYDAVIAHFQENMPEAETELYYDNPFQLLIAVILSAQCTDKRVNMTTPAIFRKFPDPASLASTNFETLLPQQQNQAPDRHGTNADQ